MATAGAGAQANIAKSGWLYRQSSVLKKWRRYFFTLTMEGMLRYFETEFATKAEDALLIPAHCTGIKSGTNVLKVKPPEGFSEKCLLLVEIAGGKSWIMCGETEDEIKAWQVALEEARHILHQTRSASAPPPGVLPYGQPGSTTYVFVDDYSRRYGYPTSVTYTSTPQVVYTNYPGQAYWPPQQTTVIYDRSRSSGYSRPLAGAATGLIAGAALGSLLWTPFVFSPLFWC